MLPQITCLIWCKVTVVVFIWFSPLHNGASNEIKEIKVCKKCPKVKPYCAPIFDPIMFKPFLDDAKLPKFCAKCFSLSKKSSIGCIFWICLWKNLKGWSDRLETWHAETLDPVLKKARKQQFYPGSPSLRIWHLKHTGCLWKKCVFRNLHLITAQCVQKWFHPKK